MFAPKPSTLQYNDMVTYIEDGTIKIPQFQRKFVWKIDQVASLLDSILKGYPIGTFIIWETKERLRSIRNLGNLQLPDVPDGENIQYVLDGQQRMTSLYIAMRGAKILGDDNRTVDYGEIYVDLEAEDDEPRVIVDIRNRDASELIKFTDLLSNDLVVFVNNYMPYIKKISEYVNAIKTYSFSTIIVKDAPLDVATEIFTRINVGGRSLSIFEIMVAKTFDQNRKFDLAEKYDELVEELRAVKYDTISSSTVLQTIAIILEKECKAKQILQLDKNRFIDAWEDTVKAIKGAIDYFRLSFRIPVSQLLPYDSLIVPFAYYFYNKQNNPSGIQQLYLQDYFWRSVLTSRFSSAVEAKLAQDIKKIDKIITGEQPTYEELIDISVDALHQHGWFATGSAYIKGLLCILAAQNPQSFENNVLVNIDNSWLKQANSKNYHHFFPKAYMRKARPEVEYWRINHIANITIVDDFLNKRKIRDRAPADYIKDFSKNNPDLQRTLATHLIGDPAAVGILSNDYELFFQKRLEAFNEELKKRIILTKLDKA